MCIFMSPCVCKFYQINALQDLLPIAGKAKFIQCLKLIKFILPNAHSILQRIQNETASFNCKYYAQNTYYEFMHNNIFSLSKQGLDKITLQCPNNPKFFRILAYFFQLVGEQEFCIIYRLFEISK